MKLFVTIAEASPDVAVAAIGAIAADHDGIEVRVERFGSYDPAAFRAATKKPLLLTRRGAAPSADEVQRAIDAGVDLVDVEFGGDLHWIAPFRDRIVLSHHDFDGMPDVPSLLEQMRSLRCAHVKIAVTPRSFADNLDLITYQAARTTLIGMGERGVFSRILGPFVGSEFSFVAPLATHSAAPGQIALDRALAIYGPDRAALHATHVFAVVGNPAGHSLSPSIHNPMFRAKGVAAAYTIASVESFQEVTEAFVIGTISGLSVTAPFKEDAYTFARSRGAALGENAAAAGSVNTLINVNGALIADNTDVDGFTQILARLCGRDRKTVALIGAGGTARAAAVATQRAGMSAIVFNRTVEKARVLAETFGARSESLDNISRFDGEIVINTVTAGAPLSVPLKPGMTYIEAAYGAAAAARVPAGVERITGVELLHAQAQRQHELFMRVFHAT